MDYIILDLEWNQPLSYNSSAYKSVGGKLLFEMIQIGAIKLNKLRPIALENLLAKLRKRTHRGKPIKEKTVQKYLTVVSAVLSDAKRNEIIEKNPARMIDLPDAERRAQEIPTMEEMQKFFSALC